MRRLLPDLAPAGGAERLAARRFADWAPALLGVGLVALVVASVAEAIAR